MESKKYTVAVLGVGGRGGDVYATLMHNAKDRFDIVALCDIRPERLSRFGDMFGVAENERFLDENDFFTKKRADLLVIATQDADHVRQAIKAFELGYDILLEKPITFLREECDVILEAQKKYGRKALVCHVLRYAPAYLRVAKMIEDGAIGRLVAIDAIERVEYAHQAHSFVRGNWRSTPETAPMILAKCCHDLDLLQYFAGSRCKTVSSVGDLTYFTPENAPDGATPRCTECPHKNDCPYSAYRLYIERWENCGSPNDRWPFNVIAEAPLSKEKLIAAIENGDYGRCVFACDNNVVDHQITLLNFENGVKASLTMTAFTATGGRRYNFLGTLGELLLDEPNGEIVYRPFGGEVQTVNIKTLSGKGYGHGGGDEGLIDALFDMLEGKATQTTSLDASIESHLMGLAAEESRLAGGKTVIIH